MVTSTDISNWVEKMKSKAVASPDNRSDIDPLALMLGIEQVFGELRVKEVVYNELFLYFCNRSDEVLSKLN